MNLIFIVGCPLSALKEELSLSKQFVKTQNIPGQAKVNNSLKINLDHVKTKIKKFYLN